MSLILEALKKSEAKRRLGEAPDLGTPFTSPKRRSNLLPLLLVAIVTVGGFGWWFLRQPATNAQTSADKAAPKTPTSMTNRSATPTPARVQPAAAVQAQTPTPPVARPQPATSPPPHPNPAPATAPSGSSGFVAGRPNPQNRAGPTQAAKLPPNMHRVQPETPPPTKSPVTATAKIAAAPSAPKPAADAHNAAVPASAPAPANTPAPAKAAKTADAPVTSPASNAPVLAKAPKTPDMRGLTPPGDATTGKNDPPFYYELPFNVRKSLPALRLSMHVYAGDPKQRFVILNDSRLSEGDKTADDVTLREVRKDGAVLEFQGQRFFYPRDSL